MTTPYIKIAVVPHDLVVGRPLPWAIYDATGVMLLNSGMAPTSHAQVTAILARNPHRIGTGADAPASRVPMADSPPACQDRRIANNEDPIPFDDLALQPGEVFRLHPALDVAGESFAVTLIGYLKNQTIVVTAPRSGGKLVSTGVGDAFNVKSFSGTSLFTFRAKITAVHAQPLPHLHLEYPKTVHVTRIRKALRAMVDIPALLFDPKSGTGTEVRLKDLSVGGARLVLPRPMGERDARYVVIFKVKIAEDLEEEVRASAIARAIDAQDTQDGQGATMGVQFQDLSKEARLLVMTLVYRQQLRKG